MSKVKRLTIVFTLLIAFLSIKIDTFAQVDSAVVPVDSVVAGSAEAVSGEHAASGHEEKKFEPTEVIMEHIADSHVWHLWGHTSLPLPIILYTPNGLEVFSSGHFHHGEEDYQGTHNRYRYVADASKQAMGQNFFNKNIKIVGADGNIDEAATAKLIDLSITKNVAALFLGVTLLLVIFISVEIGRAHV